MEQDLVLLFMDIGLSEKKAIETIKNKALSSVLMSVCQQAKEKLDGPIPKPTGNLIYHLATKIKSQIKPHLQFLCQNIVDLKLDSELKLNAAFEYLLTNPELEVNKVAFESHCGVGITVTPDQIEAAVEKVIQKYKSDLVANRYQFNVGKILTEVRENLKWADGKAVKNEVDVQILDLLGPKTEDDLNVGKKEKVKKGSKSEEMGGNKKLDATSLTAEATTIEEILKKLQFHKPGENHKTDGYIITPLTKSLLEQHVQITGGQVRTRFPPEPNGILHIGHAKAININFGYAKVYGGVCFLRYDDTNPEKEEEKYFTAIKEMVTWLGYTPYKITHSSDYFDQLYEWAKILIKKGDAYVCHQKGSEIKGFNPPPSPWRNRPIDESLQLFEDMKNGMYDEGGATLRLKVTLEEGKQDPVAYRIKYVPHHRTGDKWCVYPTYDYTHCLCDSLENITHSLCTKEFQNRRSSYYWLCNALDVYCPVQWEYGRLNVDYTVVSKRKISKLIENEIVADWDDPRLFTLTGLRRRGIPAEAINNFCAQMGVTGAQTTVDPQKLDACAREILNQTAPRAMVVLEPLKVTITNFPSQSSLDVEVSNFPSDPSSSKYKVSLSNVIYIEKDDFRETDDKAYRRFTPKQDVGLRYANYGLSFIKIEKDTNGIVTELVAECWPISGNRKPKAFIHWVSEPTACEIRLYDTLFMHKNPEDPTEVPEGFLSDCNPNSLKIQVGLMNSHLKYAKPFNSYQFERIGYFCVDPDSTSDKVVFNRTLLLKEDSNKG